MFFYICTFRVWLFGYRNFLAQHLLSPRPLILIAHPHSLAPFTLLNMITNKECDSEEELEEEDLVIQAAAAAAMAASLAVLNYAQTYNKTPYQALDASDDHSMLSSSRNSGEMPRSVVAAMDRMKGSLDNLSGSIRDMANEHRLRRLQEHKPQATGETLAWSLGRRKEAAERLRVTETYLDHDRMVAVLDLVSVDINAADTYMSIQREDYRKAWISKRLTEYGFPGGIADDV